MDRVPARAIIGLWIPGSINRSRRWGPVSRLLLGSTGEPLMRDAGCAVLAVPGPPA
jgi:nucleotide-binding universal stress UspA family protein